MANTEVERYNEVDPADVPSAAWGWSKISHRTWYAAGIFIVIFMVGMLHGNHVGHVEDIWLIGFASLVAFAIGRDWYMRRKGTLR
jgi:hypothetical protein